MKSPVLYVGMLLFAGSAVSTATAQTVDEEANLKVALSSQAPQHKLADCVFGSNSPTSFGEGTISASAGGAVTLRGLDSRGRPWSALYQAAPGAGCQLWSVNLTANSTKGLALVLFGINNSEAWDTTLSLLRFDEDGLPFPWQATSKFTVAGNGIQQIVLLGGEKTPAVMVPYRERDVAGATVVDYHGYVPRGVRFYELRGEDGGITWPLVTAHSKESPTTQTLATTGQYLTGALALSTSSMFRGITGSNDSDRRLIFTDRTVAMPDVAVVDDQNGRSIVSFPVKTDLSTVVVGHAQGVALGTNCDSGECHPVVLWFKQ